MRERPKGAPDLLPEDMEALGLTQDRVMDILLGPNREVPPPPEGFPPLTENQLTQITDEERERRNALDPRRDMPLDKQKYYAAPGEFIRIEFDRGAYRTGPDRGIWERYVLHFPSGFKTAELEDGEAGRLLMEVGFSYAQMQDILKKAQSYRKTALWPNEGVHKVVVQAQDGREYYS